MAPGANFESMSYNPFTVNDSFFNSESDPDINFYSDISHLDTKYFNPNEIREGFECLYKNGFSDLHANLRSINKNFETFKSFCSKLNCTFSVICFSETWATDNSICNDSNFQIENYTKGGGLRIFVHKEIYFKPRTDLSINSNDVGSLCIEIHHKKDKNILFSVMYRPPNGDMTVFEKFCKNVLSANDKTSKNIIFAGNLNINVLDCESNKKVQHFLSSMFQYNMIPPINKPTRVTRNTATAIDHIITNTVISGIQHRSGIIKTDISGHFPIVFALNTCEKSKAEDKVQFIYKNISKEEQLLQG